MVGIALREKKGIRGEDEEELLQGVVPTDYHGIPFDDWLDIFLQYALTVTDQGEPIEAYEALEGAATASVWWHDKRKSRMIHVCWFSKFSSHLLLCWFRANDFQHVRCVPRMRTLSRARLVGS